MMDFDRRSVLATLFAGLTVAPIAASEGGHRRFIQAAFAMKAAAEQAGDQAYGAVVVRGENIVGWGPSRVIARKDTTAHAEREAIRDAAKRLGRPDLSGCVMYSTSRPCTNCERAAAEAGIERMFFGAAATDAGRPRS